MSYIFKQIPDEEKHPPSPARLPLLFAMDGMLSIKDGYKFLLNCKDSASPLYGVGYCAAHIGCTSGCGGDSGHTSDSSDVFGSSGDSSSLMILVINAQTNTTWPNLPFHPYCFDDNYYRKTRVN